MHRVGVIAIPPVTAFDLVIPEAVFSTVVVDGSPAYDVLVCTAEPGIVASTGSMRVVVDHGLDVLSDVETVVVTGSGRRADFDPRILDVLVDAARNGQRVASICTGAFALAASGVLDGRPATTYWPYSDEFARRFPKVDVRPGVLYTDDGNVLTSAGVAAGLDLCLHLVRLDHGAAVANRAARLALVAPVRHGGQQQFIDSPLPPERGTSLAETRSWALERLADDLTLAQLAAHAHVSIRHLTRRFQAETGLSPLQWLVHQRIDRARILLESTMLPMEQVARLSGLGSSESLRQHFVKRVGITPSGYRASFAHATTAPA
ncbi:MAG: helix-turn-helix domain-containing protein [Nocardioides sp.]|uniref:GlxA family transcriptional regulator n=1 Tax=Nocardioides sp. TaxID=35761 RepID=UPI0039E6BF61